eukprot:323003-Chlamydomonas_euryale.AAC.1
MDGGWLGRRVCERVEGCGARSPGVLLSCVYSMALFAKAVTWRQEHGELMRPKKQVTLARMGFETIRVSARER